MAEGGKIGGAQFYLAQILTIASTVLGVYLAGYVGFQRTLDYDRLTRAQDHIKVVGALAAELEDNLAILEARLERMEPSGAKPIQEDDWPKLRLYVWRAAAEHPALFEIPADALSNMQAVYADAEAFLADPIIRKAYRSSSGAFAYDRRQMKARLAAVHTLGAETVAPALEATLAAPRAVLARFGAEGGAP